jgi:solute carrier family 13 (sodium-dependent dicarboxylate transporter), member 2/3/5
MTVQSSDRQSPRLSKQSIGAAAAVVLAAAIKLQPGFGQLNSTGQSALAVIALAVVLWVTDVLNAGITALLALGLLIIAGVPSNIALGGFATGAFWILVGVLFFGTAMDKTGLARRISYRILLIFPSTYSGILLAFMLIGFVLTLGVPSMTVRTAIMVPIAFALVQAIKLPLPSPGAALIVLGAFEMAVLPGCAVLTGSLWGPFLAGLFTNASLPLTWFDYARVMALPTLVWCGLIVAANLLVMRPPPTASMSKDVVRSEMQQLGRMGRPELWTAIIVASSVVAWAAQPWHRVPPEAIGMVALAALFATRVLVPGEIGTGIPWGLAIFVGGMLSLTTVMSTYKINVWLGSYIVPAVQPFAANRFLLVVALSAAVAAMRFVDPVGFITIATFFLALVGFVANRGVPPLVLTGIVLFPIHIFWFNYQNIWIVMTEGISKKSAYTDADRFKLATVFFGVTVVALWIGVAYWRVIGML